MVDEHTIRVQVKGEYACFTRPDLKVERMSYPCMTPSAARGVLDSILWKPEFQWYIRRILVLNPISFVSFRRNELSDKQKGNAIVIEESRSQRNSILLRDVSYVIEAQIYQGTPDPKNPPQKYLAMFNRRLQKGQCYRRPFLGCREFSAEFFPVTGDVKPINEDVPIGSMLLDIFFDQKGVPEPRFFYDVALRNGIIDCSADYAQMLESTHYRPKVSSEVSSILYEFKGIEEQEA
jgi:CRISPR-associated protein Cas5d